MHSNQAGKYEVILPVEASDPDLSHIISTELLRME